MNDKIKFIGSYKTVKDFIPRYGNYLYVIKLVGNTREYLKIGRSTSVYMRLRTHNLKLSKELNAEITDILIAGPYVSLNKAEALLLKKFNEKFILEGKSSEVYISNSQIDDVFDLIPRE